MNRGGQDDVKGQLQSALLREQSKDIEIERLMTTCKTLSSKANVCDDLHQEISVLRKRMAETESTLALQTEKINEYERNRQKYESNRLLQLKENKQLSVQIESLRTDLQTTFAAKEAMQLEVEASNDYVLQMEEKVYKSNKISLELLKQLKDAETEISTL